MLATVWESLLGPTWFIRLGCASEHHSHSPVIKLGIRHPRKKETKKHSCSFSTSREGERCGVSSHKQTMTSKRQCRELVHLDSSGPPGVSSRPLYSHWILHVQCVCVCVYTHIHAHTLTQGGGEKKIGPGNKKERTERKTPRGVIAQCFLGFYYPPYPWDTHNQFSIKTLLSKQIRHACHFHKWKCKRLARGPLTSLVQSRVLLRGGFLVFLHKQVLLCFCGGRWRISYYLGLQISRYLTIAQDPHLWGRTIFEPAQTTEPPGHMPLVVNVVFVGPFKEEEEGTNITSDVFNLVRWRVSIRTPQVIKGGTGWGGMSTTYNRGHVPLGSLLRKPRDRNDSPTSV